MLKKSIISINNAYYIINIISLKIHNKKLQNSIKNRTKTLNIAIK